MAVSYGKLWGALKERKMSAADLRKVSGIAPNTMTKLRRNEPVMLNVLDKICAALGCGYSEIMDYVPDGEEKKL